MDILQLIDRLEELFNESKSIPLTRNVMVDEDRMLDIIDQMRIAIPEEVKKAQQLLGQRDRVLAQAQIIIYAGGIVILILFVIMLIGSQELETRAAYRTWVPYAGLALGLALLASMTYAIMQTPITPGVNPANEGGAPVVLGMFLYTQNILLVELASVLLLAALLGALLLARKPKEV